MQKIVKAFSLATLLIILLSFSISLVGTILMFFDYNEVTQTNSYYSYYYHSYQYYDETKIVDNPEAGVMPLIATLLIIVALILFLVAKKKNYKVLISEIVFLFIAIILLSLSYFVACFDNYICIYGYRLCLVTSFLLALPIALSIIQVIILKKFNSFTAETKPTKTIKNCVSVEDYQLKAEKLKQIKSFYDDGIFNEKEYLCEKEKIMKGEY